MVDFNAEIISFNSMGNVFLHDNISQYVGDMYSNFKVDVKEYLIPFPFNEVNVAYVLDNGVLRISTTQEGVVIGVGCNENYKGRYKGKLYPGMAMEELLDLTKSRRILNGTLIVDEDYGLSFTLPSPYDEIADYIEHIPLDLKLNEIYVSDNSFWAPKK
ncbi:hypothetical protein F6Q07_22935 [Pectobacterium parmentieri]|uniref:hypothetical protein n=1 Tax=Pectobacterium parmentieri TaxID=1905730 RepID=UPI000EB1A900|nr:hypothetical protein [Pectobacterium parmentieri]AYG99819.1 hypothetical protein C5E26_01925 [Pectobacterium parmentieri]AYH26057.1 hypothetical protein C5E20_02130 [Pectobacterium parmentieri]AYH30511.1 hypothetical protein C5E19_01920 [Pectobacterium parmentieri]MBI0520910.1 hypothetical protein [Pectobacterium parmentieri]QHQ17385.1 hypothetical protein GMW39_17130 [Pectobacterium parmentieri]